MNESVVFMFSGQGSQYYNMGRELYFSNSTFKMWMDKLNLIFYNQNGESLLDILYDSSREKSQPFDNIRYTHPAIFMVEYSLAQVLLGKGIYPDYVLGTSLGEFTACAISGVLSCEDVMDCLMVQAQMLEANCIGGGMLAVVNDYRLYDMEPILHNNLELASVNFHSHFVVSGSQDKLKKAETYLKAKEVLFLRLPVKIGFHSYLVDPIALEYTQFLKTKVYRNPQVEFVSAMKGGIVKSIDSSYLWDVVRKPMEFQGALKSLDSSKEHIYIDLGPSGTLANFTKYNLDKESQSNIFSIITPFNNELKNLERMLS